MSDRTDREAVAVRLRQAREHLGLTQAAVSMATGLPRTAVSAIENGSRRVNALELRRLAETYRQPAGWFLAGTTSEPNGDDAVRMVEELDRADRDMVLAFAEFLRGTPAGVTA